MTTPSAALSNSGVLTLTGTGNDNFTLTNDESGFAHIMDGAYDLGEFNISQMYGGISVNTQGDNNSVDISSGLNLSGVNLNVHGHGGSDSISVEGSIGKIHSGRHTHAHLDLEGTAAGVNLDGSNNVITINGTVSGSLYMGHDSDSLSIGSSGTIDGNVWSGGGMATVSNDGSIDGTTFDLNQSGLNTSGNGVYAGGIDTTGNVASVSTNGTGI